MESTVKVVGYYLDVGVTKETAEKYDAFVVYIEGEKRYTHSPIKDYIGLKKDITGTDFLVGCKEITKEEYLKITKGIKTLEKFL